MEEEDEEEEKKQTPLRRAERWLEEKDGIPTTITCAFTTDR